MRKPKKCTQCDVSFSPMSMGHIVCSVDCAIKQHRQSEQKKIFKRKSPSSQKTLGQLKKEAQRVFNTFIRIRDSKEPCISCGVLQSNFPFHAGHYRAVGTHPELRFHEDNVHKQCQRCNTWLSGNLLEYRISLLKKIGQDRVDYLEGPVEKPRYRSKDIIEMIKNYADKIKELM